MTRDEILHILRNPHGKSAEEVRNARLEACNLIEAADEWNRQNIVLRGLLFDGYIDAIDAVMSGGDEE